MFKSRFSFVLAVIACLALPATGLAAPFGSEIPDTVDRLASGALDQPRVVEQPAGAVAVPAQAPVVYILQPQAAAPAASSSGGSVAIGVLGAIPGEVWGALLGVIATLLFSLWKGTGASKARDIVLQLAEGAWYVAEKNGGAGAKKFADACDAFHKALTGAGLKLDTTAIALRDSTFGAMSAADKVARQRTTEAEIRAKAEAQAAAETKLSTAGELLAEAAR